MCLIVCTVPYLSYTNAVYSAPHTYCVEGTRTQEQCAKQSCAKKFVCSTLLHTVNESLKYV